MISKRTTGCPRGDPFPRDSPAPMNEGLPCPVSLTWQRSVPADIDP
jgi:hypothetical protein